MRHFATLTVPNWGFPMTQSDSVRTITCNSCNECYLLHAWRSNESNGGVNMILVIRGDMFVPESI